MAAILPRPQCVKTSEVHLGDTKHGHSQWKGSISHAQARERMHYFSLK